MQDPKKIKELYALNELVKMGDDGIVNAIALVNKKVDKKAEELDAKIQSVNEIKLRRGKQGEKGEKGDKGEPGKDGKDGKDGENYILKEKDIKTISKMVEVPIVEKVIEKTERIIEQPIELVREVRIKEIPKEFETKIKDFGRKLKSIKVKNYDDEVATLQNRTQLLNQLVGGALGRITELEGASDTATVDAAGNDTEVQFNDGGILGADSTFTFNKTTKELNANAFVTTGGTSSDFVKGDGSLDSTSYATDSEVFGSLTSGYLPYYDSVDFANSPVYTDGTNVGIGTTSTTGKLNINTGSASTIGQIIQGSASQTANLTQWLDSAGDKYAWVSKAGGMYIGRGAGTGHTSADPNSTYLDISWGGIPGSIIIGADTNSDTRTNNTAKGARIGIAPYDTSKKAVAMLVGQSLSAGNTTLYFGGGTSTLEPATYLYFMTGPMGGSAVERMGIGASEVVFNETGVDFDFRVEGDTDTSLLMVDAGNDRVGIGTSSPSAKLHTLGTTEQLRIGYDASNYWNATTYSNGATDFDAYGSAPSFTFNQRGADVDFRIESDISANLFHCDAGNDSVGIGTTGASNSKLYVSTGISTNQTHYGQRVNKTYSISTDDTTEVNWAADYQISKLGTGKAFQIRGLSGTAVLYSDATYSYGLTGSNYLNPATPGTATILYAINGANAVNTWTSSSVFGMYFQNTISTGTVTSMYGAYVRATNMSGAGSVTSSYGLYVGANANSGGGTITNSYGLYIEDFSTQGTNKHALYTLGGNVVFNESGTDSDFRIEGDTDPNLFFIDGGNDRVGVGTTSPASKFHIVSRTEPLRIGYDVSNYYSTTVGTTGGVTFDAVGVGASFTFSDNVNINAQLYVTDGAYQTWLVDGASAGYFDDGVNYVRLANGSYAVETSGPVYIYTPSTEGLHIDGSLNYPSLHATNGGNGGNFSVVLVDENNYVGFGAGAGVFSDGTNTVLLSTGTYAIDATGDIKHSARIIRSKNVYTGTDTTTDVYHHICDSASAFTLTVSDGTDNGEEIRIINRGAGTVTLSGNISSVTATSTLLEGETITLVWDSGDGEWQ